MTIKAALKQYAQEPLRFNTGLADYFNNKKIARYLAKKKVPLEKIRAALESRSCVKASYFGQSHSFGPRWITEVELLNGDVVKCHIPLAGDTGFSMSYMMDELGGWNIAKWVKEVRGTVVWYDYHGKPWYLVEHPTRHDDVFTIPRNHLMYI